MVPGDSCARNNARSDLIVTAIIKLDILYKSFCHKSLVGTEIIYKTPKYYTFGTPHSLGSSDIITYVNIMTLMRP